MPLLKNALRIDEPFSRMTADEQTFLERFREVVSDQPRPDITLATTFDELDAELDSLAIVMLISMLEEQYGADLDGAAIRQCGSVQALWEATGQSR